MRPEQPARVTRTASYLKARHPGWMWTTPPVATDSALLKAHTKEHLKRITHGPDIDEDTPHFPNIHEHARRAAGSAIEAASLGLQGSKAFSLMRPPGHHAKKSEAMGFCYINSIATAALNAREKGAERVAIWDFDAHHGNGTEDIVLGAKGIFFASVHQYPGYPGTGTHSAENCHNFIVAPNSPREMHMVALERSFEKIRSFRPDLILVSAGFDAYARDPITSMTLEKDDFSALGHWLLEEDVPTAAILEGGYSEDLPDLVDSFLTAWQGPD